jgi:hypothetical protein
VLGLGRPLSVLFNLNWNTDTIKHFLPFNLLQTALYLDGRDALHRLLGLSGDPADNPCVGLPAPCTAEALSRRSSVAGLACPS